MYTILLTTHLIVTSLLVFFILIQRSEGGGIGLGTSSNQFLSAKSKGNTLTKITSFLAILFFSLALCLTLLTNLEEKKEGQRSRDIEERLRKDSDPPTQDPPLETSPPITPPVKEQPNSDETPPNQEKIPLQPQG